MESLNRRPTKHMQENSLNLLEEKVLHAVQRIQDLKAENEELIQSRSDLESQLTTMKDQYESAQRDLNTARDQAASAEQLENKRRIIEEKVGSLLDKLDAIE
jgi:FtsZ-binding cell division protein ZapB